MKTIKQFIVWVNYDLEGWSIFGEPGFFYKGDPVQNHRGMRLGKAVLDIMVDGKLSHVKVPERQDGE